MGNSARYGNLGYITPLSRSLALSPYRSLAFSLSRFIALSLRLTNEFAATLTKSPYGD